MRYQQASALFEEFKNIIIDERLHKDAMMQTWHRDFMRAFAHNTTDRKQYIDIATDYLSGTEQFTEYEQELYTLINHMEQF